jgi:Ca2+-binding EF-hand superfamily protein
LSNRHFKLAALAAIIAAAPAVAAAQAAGQAGAAPQTIARTTVVQDLGTSFKGVDTNGDGSLSQAEIAAAEARSIQRRVAQIRTELETEFTKADTNKDGQLSKAEFLAAGPQAPPTAPNGAEIVAQLDTNKDGKVTLAEFSADRLSAFDALDTNHDGTLSVAERQAASQR